MTVFLMVWLLAVYLTYIIINGKVLFNRIVFIAILYVLAIVLSATINKTHLITTLVYFIFPLLPLSVFLYAHINIKEKFLSFENIFKFFFHIGLIQLPLILAQQYLYFFLIKFNNSGQAIDPNDFMFGSFFIKSDHSLGVFLLLLIATILYQRKRVAPIVKLPWPAILYLLTTLFLTESNISKLVATILILTSLVVPFYRKYGESIVFKLVVLTLGVTIIIAGYSLRDKPFLQKRLGGPLLEQLSMERAERYYELRTAKRFQIVMVAAGRLETKWIGDGPYSYFDIRSGKFTKAPHFSQLLWTYFDLGMLGLLIVLMYLWSIVHVLFFKSGIIKLFFFSLLLLYSFYTTLFADIAILFGLFSIFSHKP
jgi:hypothetical protein